MPPGQAGRTRSLAHGNSADPIEFLARRLVSDAFGYYIELEASASVMMPRTMTRSLVLVPLPHECFVDLERVDR